MVADKDNQNAKSLAELQRLVERRDWLLRAIEDCERYLVVAAEFTSTEEQQRTASDIRDYQEEVASLAQREAALRGRLGLA